MWPSLSGSHLPGTSGLYHRNSEKSRTFFVPLFPWYLLATISRTFHFFRVCPWFCIGLASWPGGIHRQMSRPGRTWPRWSRGRPDWSGLFRVLVVMGLYHSFSKKSSTFLHIPIFLFSGCYPGTSPRPGPVWPDATKWGNVGPGHGYGISTPRTRANHVM